MTEYYVPEGFEIERPGQKKAAPPVEVAPVEAGPDVYVPEGFEVERPTDKGWSRMVTDIPGEIGSEFMRGLEKVKSLATRDRSKEGAIEGTVKTGEGLLGIPQMALSIPVGAVRAPVGHLYAKGVQAVGNLISPETVAKEDYEGVYQEGKDAADAALAGFGRRLAGPRGPATPPPGGPPPSGPGPGGEVVAAADRLSDAFGQVSVPKAIASDSMATQRLGQGLRNMPIVGDAIPAATGRLTEDLGRVVGKIADEYGSGTGPNVANRIGRQVSEAADIETKAATEAARRSDERVRNAWQSDVDLANRNISARETAATERARAATGDVSPQDMGQTLIQRLRATEAEARANKERLYTEAGGIDAAIRADEVSNIRSRVGAGLEEAGVFVDPTGPNSLTRAAGRMLDEIENLAKLQIGNRAIGARVPAHGDETIGGVSVQALERVRQRLNAIKENAETPGDARAARAVMRQFDEWHANAMETALLSGDPRALPASRAARDANRSWRNRFFNEEDDAGKLINRIVTGEVTPQEVANLIVGSGQIGAKGVASRILTRIDEATNGSTEVIEALRGGIWNRLTQTPEGMTPKNPQKIADDISQFLNGSGRDVANRLFTAEQRAAMQAQADTLRQGRTAREAVEEVAAQTEPTKLDVPKGPAQKLADTVLGRGKSDEALFRTIDDYAKSGGRANLKALSDLVQSMPQAERADLANAIIRNLGGGGEKFSPDIFATNWGKYTPQAKAILFGNAGHTLRALDDMAIISQRVKDTAKRFGNPSGTAQSVNLMAAMATFYAYPNWKTAAGLGGGYVISRILASPAGAAATSRWSRAWAAMKIRPTAAAMAEYQAASNGLAAASKKLGINVDPANFGKALQAPAGSTDDKQQK